MIIIYPKLQNLKGMYCTKFPGFTPLNLLTSELGLMTYHIDTGQTRNKLEKKKVKGENGPFFVQEKPEGFRV